MVLGELLPYAELLLPILFVIAALAPWAMARARSGYVRAAGCLALGFGAFFLLGEVLALGYSPAGYGDYVTLHTQDPRGLLPGLSVDAHYVIEPLVSFLSIGAFCFACAATAGLVRRVGPVPAAAFAAMGFVAVLPLWKAFPTPMPGGVAMGGLDLFMLGLLFSAALLAWAGLVAVKAFNRPGRRGWALRVLGVLAGVLLSYFLYVLLVSMQYYLVGSRLVESLTLFGSIKSVVLALSVSRLWFFALLGFTSALALWTLTGLLRPREETVKVERSQAPDAHTVKPVTRVDGAPQKLRIPGQPQQAPTKLQVERKPVVAAPTAPAPQAKAAPGAAPPATPRTPPTPKAAAPQTGVGPAAPSITPPSTPTLPAMRDAQPPPAPLPPIKKLSELDPYNQLVQEMAVFYKYLDRVERKLAAPTIVRFRDEYSELARRFPSSDGRAEAERLLRAIEGRYMSGFERR